MSKEDIIAYICIGIAIVIVLFVICALMNAAGRYDGISEEEYEEYCKQYFGESDE